ncbi:type I-E CRISPR-associated protein Cas6/Cse3/CasE [Lactobacillus corticis]|uniref:CRISPR-associated protein n=1 Tax=Lactobacillus corticis TaxID=2201249 RepID=A0A916VGM9_9LACO|nr:type I-E CRISPR-associated protein Cas6/Cse3/CasE [Lactobacillus corticis]GFZ26131.1 CRISPR-associated protein [Lactobacillus corticis]
MYLSRVKINDQNRRLLKDLNHAGAYHNWVEHCFPEEIEQQKRLRHLWRIDYLSGERYLLVLSENKPDLRQMEKYGVPGTAMTKDYSKFLDNLTTGMPYQFRFTGNPVHRVAPADGGRSKTYPHVTVAQQMEWLSDRSELNGFKLHEFNVVNRQKVMLRHHNSRPVKLSCVSFEGMLEITDLNKFKAALINGIGREKSYGMGLLTVIPYRG